MKRLWVFSLLLCAALRVFGAGIIIVGDDEFWRRHPPGIIPPRPVPPRPPVWVPVEVAYTKADVKITDQFATTKVEQEFYNPNARQLEGTFLFPVPRGAHLDKFTLHIDGKPVEAELLAGDKARAIYEDIVRRAQDPGLLEYAGRDLFKVRIFPIEPHSRRKVTLTWSQLLKADSGLTGFTLPLNTTKFSGRPLRSVSVKVELETRRPLKALYSPTHTVETKRDGARRATVGFESTDARPDTDFQLFYSQEEGDLGVTLLTHKPAGEDGYFVLIASPGVEMKESKVIPKDVVFVLDTSGSMAGPKLDQAKKALAFCIENLNATDRFEILRFSTEVEPLFDKLVDYSPDNKARARKFIESLRPIGGTAIDDALRKAVSLRQDGPRPCVIVFLTDGRPTVGDIDEHHILQNATKPAGGLTRIFCFGIGTDVNTHLLDRIAEDTRAASQYVLPEEDIEVKVSSFFTKIREPVLASPKLTFPPGIRVTKVYPAPLPDVFKGGQIIVAGRYSGSGDGAIQIEGSIGAETRRFAYDVKFPAQSAEHEFVPRLWATRRVGHLLDEIRLRGESRELKDEITELARQYGIVTPYTAYLILEDERRRNVPMSMQTLPEMREQHSRRTVDRLYSRVGRDKAGDAAVADARSFQMLKSAEAPQSAIASGTFEALRPPVNASQPAATAARLEEVESYQGQGRFVAGRTFFRNDKSWIDGDVQKKPDAPRVRLPFGSPEYFAFARTNTAARPWLALGRNVQFTLNGTVYEITD
jgi:Ca-activated chloride channel family protein